MSEPKTYFLGKNNGREFPVYLKSEADEVINELKSDYKEACDRLQTANLTRRRNAEKFYL